MEEKNEKTKNSESVVSETTTQAAEQPVTEPTAEPVVKATAEPASKSIVEPTTEVQDVKKLLPPISGVSMHLTRFGKIFSHITFTCAILLALACLSMLILPLAQVLVILLFLCLLFVMIVFTLGTVFAFPGKPVSKVWDLFLKVLNVEFSVQLSNFCFSLIPYLTTIGFLFGILSILTLIFVRPKKPIGRMILVGVLMLLMILPLIFYNVMGGVLWQN